MGTDQSNKKSGTFFSGRPDARGPSAFGPRWIAALALLLAALVSVSFQGSRGLYETSEARYAECAREMLESGNFREPTLGYEAHWTKPPLSYWTFVAGMKVFGVNEWGLRLPNALAFVLTTLVVMRLGGDLGGRRVGAVSGLIYATSPFPVFAANSLTTDTILALWEVAAVACYVRAWRGAPAGERLWVAGMWAMFGLGFMTKGPPAMLALAGIVAWRRIHRGSPRVLSFAGLALFLLVVLPWFVLVAAGHRGLFSHWLSSEIVGRLTASEGHHHPWYTGFTVLLPCLLLGVGLWAVPLLREIHARRLAHWRTLRGAVSGGGVFAFLFLWAAIPLVVFMLSSSKLPLYVLPFAAPVAIGAAFSLQAVRVGRFAGWSPAIAVLTAFVLVAGKAMAARKTDKRDMRAVWEMCRPYDDGKADFYGWDVVKSNGLQFYLGGRLKAASFSGLEPWADVRFSGLFAELVRESRERTLVLIVRNSIRSKALEESFAVRGARYRKVSNRYWAVYAFAAPDRTGSPGGSNGNGDNPFALIFRPNRAEIKAKD